MDFHLTFLATFVLAITATVHAGIQPQQAVNSQIASTLLEFRAAGLASYVPEGAWQLNSALWVRFNDSNTEAELGSTLDRDDVQNRPTMVLNYTQGVNASAPFRQTRYTIFILDAGAPGVGLEGGQNATIRQYQAHNTTIDDDSGELKEQGEAFVEYRQPEASGEVRRIMQLVFAQPVNWVLPNDLRGDDEEDSNNDFELGDWLRQANVTTLVAANYYILAPTQGEEPSNATISSTSSVPAASVSSLASSISASLNSSYAQPTTVGGIVPNSTSTTGTSVPDAATITIAGGGAWTAILALIVTAVAGGALI